MLNDNIEHNIISEKDYKSKCKLYIKCCNKLVDNCPLFHKCYTISEIDCNNYTQNGSKRNNISILLLAFLVPSFYINF